eukprot:TRINITY_DN6774_c0_g1_i1.p1 TRINITY_DN6774_c0_g1~~TRINITY_DN6774_c0_g1_i1.p1  ORF type:complete len:340 (+),score=110.47 TRINITY_DN6774_c0_g1_i1:112-1131(+)
MGCGGSTQNGQNDVDQKNKENKEKYECLDEKEKSRAREADKVNDDAPKNGDDSATPTDKKPVADSTDPTPTPETGADDSNKAAATDTEPDAAAGTKTAESPSGEKNGVGQSDGGGTPTQSPSQQAETGARSQSSMFSMVPSTTTSASELTNGEVEDDPDEAVMRVIQKVREQALADARKYGFSEVKVKGVSIRSIGGPVELSPKDMQRIRRWTDYLPPFDPIPPAAEPTENGRHPRENTLRVNQELLDAWERDQKAAARQSSSPRPGQAAQTPSSKSREKTPTPEAKQTNLLNPDLNATGASRDPASNMAANNDTEVLSPAPEKTPEAEMPKEGEKQDP